jgi:L,D-transpeptidase ErfK/SrfK
MMSRILALASILFLLSSVTHATTFNLSDGNAVYGEVQYRAGNGETTVSLAQRYDLGLNSIIAANPGLAENSSITERSVTIPTAFILPPMPRQGIVINLPEMRLYFYPDDSTVMTFPIGIGKVGKTIPLTTTSVTRKVVNPTWIPTPDIREYNRKQGIDLPLTMGPGPDNPLGPYAIYMRVPTYLIHSTIFPESIGRRASFGCIRMNEDDIKTFFPLVKPGIPVAIVNMPVKAGWQGDRLYVQIFPPLVEHGLLPGGITEMVQRILPRNQLTFVNWQAIAYLTEQPDGIPHEVGFKAKE